MPPQREGHSRRNASIRTAVAASIATILCAATVSTSYGIWVWNATAEPMFIWIPGYVFIWGFLGGSAAVLSDLLYPTPGHRRAPSPWLAVICRPILGAVVGAVAYLLVKAGVLVLTSTPQGANTATGTATVNPEFFAGIAFIAGFADRSTSTAFRRLARGWARAEDGDSPEKTGTSEDHPE